MFYDNYVRLCNSIGKAPSAVAVELGLKKATVTRWKKGGNPTDANAQKIAEYFNVSVDYLLGVEDTSSYPSPPVSTGGIWIPVLGRVAAGIPIDAIEDIEDYEEIPLDMAQRGNHFALRIQGDSMEPRISDGDVVIVRQQEDCEDGDIAVVMVNGDSATVKRIKKQPEGIMLIPNNTAYEPKFYSNKDIEKLPVRILGKVVELRAKF